MKKNVPINRNTARIAVDNGGASPSFRCCTTGSPSFWARVLPCWVPNNATATNSALLANVFVNVIVLGGFNKYICIYDNCKMILYRISIDNQIICVFF